MRRFRDVEKGVQQVGGLEKGEGGGLEIWRKGFKR